MIEYYLVAFRTVDFLKIFRKTMFLGFGVILVILGLCSLLIPFSPGLLLIFLGLTYLVRGSKYLKKHKMLNKTIERIKKFLYRYKKA